MTSLLSELRLFGFELSRSGRSLGREAFRTDDSHFTFWCRSDRLNMSAPILCLLLVVVSLMASSEAQPIDGNRPIFMARREASAFGDIIGELKGKGLGGRMRFGKRSSSPSSEILSDLRALYGEGPTELISF